MELLAPAGTKENFIAALDAGADAIYLGGKVFNARAKAGNFSIEEIAEGVKVAHLLGVAVYVTVNILIGDSELKELEQCIKSLHKIGVDAVIVQDLATAQLVKKVAPQLAIHGSTQMTATNLGTVEFLRKQGFSRIVLARELSLEEIAYICQNTTAEIEVFVHGALCICYSGQCLMSSFIGGRSGNRGACAQPCRLPYELCDDKGTSLLAKEQSYILSPKDLNYSEYLKELSLAGVHSLKIEGRMKKVSYVREVIGTYRSILENNGVARKESLTNLDRSFNRGFSQAYLTGTTGRQMMTILAPNNQGQEMGHAERQGRNMKLQLTQKLEKGNLLKIISTDGKNSYFTVTQDWLHAEMQNKSTDNLFAVEYMVLPEEEPAIGIVYLVSQGQGQGARNDFSHLQRKINVYIYLSDAEGEPVQATFLTDTDDCVTVTNEYILAKARTTPTDAKKIFEQMNRMGNTVFHLEGLTAPEESFMWPTSVLNQLRRDGLEKLEQTILQRYEEAHRQKCLVSPMKYPFAASQASALPCISVRCGEWGEVQAAVDAGAHKIIFGGDRYQRMAYEKDIYGKVVDYCHAHDVYISISTPRIVKAAEEKAYKVILADIIRAKPDSVAIHFLGALEWLAEMEYTGAVEGDVSLNLFNSKALEYITQLGLTSIAVSEEATLEQIRKMATRSRIPIECVVQGRAELMVSEYCAIGAFLGNGEKNGCPMPCQKGSYFLKDRKGVFFPLKTDPYCRMHILNSCETDMRPYVEELQHKGVNIFRLEGRGQTAEYIRNMVMQYQGLLDGTLPPVPKEIRRDEEVTRGHYFKGIF